MNTQPHKNILFLLTDDQRFDTIAALGNPHIHTPNFDRLVQNGTAFTNAFIQGGTVEAVCMPSRAMLHTGRNLFELHDHGASIPEHHTLLGETFQQAGYEVFGTGKWHNSHTSYARSFSSGKEIFFGGMDDHWNVPVCDFDPSGQYDYEHDFCFNPKGTNKTLKRRAHRINFGKHSTDICADAIADFLNQHPADRPFFAYSAFLAPHDPRTMPKQFLDLYRDKEIPLPPNALPEHPFDNGSLRVRDEKLEEFPRRPERIVQHIREYYGMISHLDFQIGRLLDLLEKRNLLDNTLIVLMGDNGLAVGQHGLMGKQNLYDHSVRVPLLLSGPGIECGKIRDDLVITYDLFPTLCDYAGIQPPASATGQSFLRHEDLHTDLYLAYSHTQRAIRTKTHKLIETTFDHQLMTQLFDIGADPWETNNLATDHAHFPLLQTMRETMKMLAKSAKDTTSA